MARKVGLALAVLMISLMAACGPAPTVIVTATPATAVPPAGAPLIFSARYTVDKTSGEAVLAFVAAISNQTTQALRVDSVVLTGNGEPLDYKENINVPPGQTVLVPFEGVKPTETMNLFEIKVQSDYWISPSNQKFFVISAAMETPTP